MDLYERTLPDGRTITVSRLTFGRARLSVGRGLFFDDNW